MITRTIVITGLLTLLFAFSANASIIDVTTGVGSDGLTLENTWLSSVGNTVTESFEGLDTNTGTTSSGIQLAIGTLYGYGHVGSDGTITNPHKVHAVDGDKWWDNGSATNANQKGDFILDLDGSTNAIGFYLIDANENQQVTITVETLLGSETINLYDYTGKLADGSEIYVLLQTDSTIESITFHKSGNDGYGIDKITTAATPISGAVWLLGSGLFGLVGMRRRGRNA